MTGTKFIGLDVHKTSISAAVLDEDGKLVMQSLVATQANAIVELLQGIRGTLHVTRPWSGIDREAPDHAVT